VEFEIRLRESNVDSERDTPHNDEKMTILHTTDSFESSIRSRNPLDSQNQSPVEPVERQSVMRKACWSSRRKLEYKKTDSFSVG